MCMEECKSLSSVVICNTTCINGNCLHQGELIKCIANFLTRYVGRQGAYNVKRAGECGSKRVMLQSGNKISIGVEDAMVYWVHITSLINK